MAIFRGKITKHKCERCGHVWIPKKKIVSMLCPSCKSPYWDKPLEKKDE